MSEIGLRERILNSTIDVFNVKGMKFTMDDIARNLNISKKTIYTVFTDKEQLLLNMVDYVFDSIKDEETKVINDERLTTKEKIKKIMGVMPDGYKEIDFSKLYILKDKYPDIYLKVEKRLETGWETTINLIEKGIKEDVIRPVNIQVIKMMMEASLEQFFQRDILVKNSLSYTEGLEMIVDILTEGMFKND